MAGFSLSEEIVERVNGAFGAGLPILIGYVDDERQARLSFRGSTHVHGDDQLAVWVRNPEGGLLGALGENPKLTFMYRDPESRTTLFFYGRGRVEADAATRARVYGESPEPERNADPDQKGKALVVDIDLVQGRTPAGPVNLERT